MTEALEVGEWSAARPGRTLPAEKTRYPLYRRLGGLQGRSREAENLAPHRDSIPGPSSPQSVAILTELPDPHKQHVLSKLQGTIMDLSHNSSQMPGARAAEIFTAAQIIRGTSVRSVLHGIFLAPKIL